MRAIIIEDKDARALLDSLKLERLILDNDGEPVVNDLVSNIHAKFHYVVTRWLQDQGASVTR